MLAIVEGKCLLSWLFKIREGTRLVMQTQCDSGFLVRRVLRHRDLACTVMHNLIPSSLTAGKTDSRTELRDPWLSRTTSHHQPLHFTIFENKDS